MVVGAEAAAQQQPSEVTALGVVTAAPRVQAAAGADRDPCGGGGGAASRVEATLTSAYASAPEWSRCSSVD